MKTTLFIATALVCSAGTDIAPSRNALEDFSEAVQQMVKELTPAVLPVLTDGFGGSGGAGDGNTTVSHQTGVASCVAVSADGDLITNAHVLNGVRRVRVRLDGHLVDVEVAGVDRETDLALLKLARGTPHHLELADSSLLRQGQVVFTVGSPQALNNSLSMGVVSAVSRGFGPDSSQSFIQTDAPINPGNSGGPLVNTRGEIVGINTFILSQSGGSEGLGFAIPSNLVRDVYAQLKQYGRVHRGEIGVVARSMTPAIAKALGLAREDGVLIQDVEPGRAAADAGVQANDIVVAIAGRPVRNLRQFSDSLFGTGIGEHMALDVIRNGETLSLQVALEDHNATDELLAQQIRTRASPVPQLGVLVVPLDAATAGLVPDARQKSGSIVAARLQTTSPLQEELEVGDIIVSVNGKPASNVEELQRLLSLLPEDSAVVVRAQRGGVLRYFVLRGD